MESQIIKIDIADWHAGPADSTSIAALEAGKVLYFPHLLFALTAAEQRLYEADLRDPKQRNISLDARGQVKGMQGDTALEAEMATMIGRFRQHARDLVQSLLPRYADSVRLAPTTFRPLRVETRPQPWRDDEKRLHVDAASCCPTSGERLLRVFANINPAGLPRVWRVGEPFEIVARQFLPRLKKYSPKKAKMLHALRVTKSLRSEYDHLMLQLHEKMKTDLDYQQDAHQTTVEFAPGSVWMCYSDQTSHAVMSGQFMLEQTLHLPVAQQYDPGSSPLAILARLTKRALA
ncbi:MAG: Kdo hydroxylase family protein [Herminiimonas sp.]|nr:Kdo hydroxylase family protein [Herminiimonas sp.]